MIDPAQHIVTSVAQGDFAAVEQRLAAPLKPYLPAGSLQTTWQGLEQQLGAFQQAEKTVRRADTAGSGPRRHLSL